MFSKTFACFLCACFLQWQQEIYDTATVITVLRLTMFWPLISHIKSTPQNVKYLHGARDLGLFQRPKGQGSCGAYINSHLQIETTAVISAEPWLVGGGWEKKPQRTNCNLVTISVALDQTRYNTQVALASAVMAQLYYCWGRVISLPHHNAAIRVTLIFLWIDVISLWSFGGEVNNNIWQWVFFFLAKRLPFDYFKASRSRRWIQFWTLIQKMSFFCRGS